MKFLTILIMSLAVTGCQLKKAVVIHGNYLCKKNFDNYYKLNLLLDSTYIFSFREGLIHGVDTGSYTLKDNYLLLNSCKKKKPYFSAEEYVTNDKKFLKFRFFEMTTQTPIPFYVNGQFFTKDSSFTRVADSNGEIIIKRQSIDSVIVSLLEKKYVYEFLDEKNNKIVFSIRIGKEPNDYLNRIIGKRLFLKKERGIIVDKLNNCKYLYLKEQPLPPQQPID